MNFFYQIFLFIIIIQVCISCNSNQKANIQSTGNELTTIEFENTNHDFGRLIRGEIVSYTYRFKNTGSAPLKIEEAIATCSCTEVKYNDTQIEAGEKGNIEVIFNSEGLRNNQLKSVIIKTNTEPKEHILDFTAFVEVNN